MENRDNTLPGDLLEILACPLCKGEIEYDRRRNILICRTCKVYFEIIDGIPDMVPEDAKPLGVESGDETPEGT